MPRAWPGSRTGPGSPEWAGLHSRQGESIVLLGSRDPGIQVTAKVESGFAAFEPYCVPVNIRQSAIRLGK